MQDATVREYDVALSFAGEDRPYVEQVAAELSFSGVRVFYDGYEQATLWGKNLYDHLSDVYQHRSRFTVMFISEAYASKLWTNHERKTAQARAFEESHEYILPARFDDVNVPGLLRTIAYIDLKTTSPQQLSDLIVKKLQQSSEDVGGPRHKLIAGNVKREDLRFSYAAIEVLPEVSTDSEQKGPLSHSHILVRPSQYHSFNEILDDIFAHYLVDRVKPFSYGLEWLIESYSDRLYLAPPQWVGLPRRAAHAVSPSWMASSPSELRIAPGTHWKIRFLKGRDSECNEYVLACNSEEMAYMVLNYSKAVFALKLHELVKQVYVDEVSLDQFRHAFVLRDWLRLCDRTADVSAAGRGLALVQSEPIDHSSDSWQSVKRTANPR